MFKEMFLAVGLAFMINLPAYADNNKAASETKQVCVDLQGKDGKPVIDPKTNKPKQNCVTVKVREKFEGTKVPDKK